MKRISVIVVCIVTIVLTAGCLAGCGAGSKSDEKDAVKYNVGKASISDPIENIEIDWMSGKVDFEQHEGKTIDISEQSKKELSDEFVMRWAVVDDNTLEIRYSKPKFEFKIGESPKKNLKVVIPKDLELGDLKVDTASGEVNGKAIKAKNMNIDVTSGDIDVDCTGENLDIDSTSGEVKAIANNAKKINIEATSGDIDLVQKGSADSVAVECSSGDSHLKLEKVSALEIDCTSGDVNISLPKGTGFTATVDTTSGSFSGDFAMKKNEDKYVAGDGSTVMKIDSTSGDVTIKGY